MFAKSVAVWGRLALLSVFSVLLEQALLGAPPAQPIAPAERLAPVSAPENAGPVPVEATSFHGVTPGVTTREAVEKAWGTPKASRKQNDLLVQLYSVGSFPQVEVFYREDRVISIIIRFGKGFAASKVAEQLNLTSIRPVLVSNELGEILGEVYPEHGVLFSFEPAADPSKALKKVTHIILEPISVESFMLRAETDLESHPEASLHDLDQALKLQPDIGRAHWLRSRAFTLLGEYDRAVSAAGDAVRLEPKDVRFMVSKAQALAQAGRVAEAVPAAEKALELSPQRAHLKPRALCLLGDLIGSAAKPDYKKALDFHKQAVLAANAFLASRHPAIRLTAKEAYLDAHLGAAHDVGWGPWREKERSVESWLASGAAMADDLIQKEGGSEDYHFRVAARALSAEVGLGGRLDPTPWATQAVRSGDGLIATATEPVRRSQLQWELATALYDALQIYQMRSDRPAAVKYGELAIGYLEKSGRQSRSPANRYLLGRLYFRMGAVYAVSGNDHKAAVEWFEKAVPLLGKTPPPEALGDLGRLGESFVSMGVSYWSTGQQEKALAMTQHGADLMEEAVKQGGLDARALAVPYANLASMHRQLGNRDKAERLEVMAARSKDGQVR
jgi:tetratricopeptide (TPR) repeat protein